MAAQDLIGISREDLDGLRQKLSDVGEELKKLRDQGWLSNSQADRYRDLQAQEKQLKDALAFALDLERSSEYP